MSKVSIVITAFLPSTKPFLDECIQSVWNLDWPKEDLEVIVVSPKSYAPNYEGVKTVSPETEDYHNPVGINTGVRASDPASKYIFLCNDDLILTKNVLKNLVAAAGDSPVMVNPLSPCGLFSNYAMHLRFKKDEDWVIIDKAQHRYDDVKEYFNDMMNADSLYPSGLISQNWLAIFATLIPRNVWDMVGEFDEGFATSQDDLDYSWRAKKLGIGLVLALDCLVFHFSGVSADTTMKIKNRLHSAEYFHKKWGTWPPGMDQDFIDNWRKQLK